jgi:hypothetical protein
MDISPSNLFIWGIILIGVILDAWLIWTLDRHFDRLGIPHDVRVRFRYIQAEFPKWLACKIRQALAPEIQQHLSALRSPTAILFFAAIPALLMVLQYWLNVRKLLPTMPWLGQKTVFVPEHFGWIVLAMVAALGLVANRPGVFSFETPTRFHLPKTSRLTALQWLAVGLIYLSLSGFLLIAAASLIAEHTPGWEMALVLSAFLLGWLLWDFSWPKWARRWHDHAAPGAAMLFGHLGLVAWLYNTYGRPERSWMLDALSLAALLGLLVFWRRIPGIYWIVSLALAAFTWQIDAWWFSTIGDEFNFYTYGREIIEQHDLAFVGLHLFNGQAVYGSHPYLSSLIQAGFMQLFGVHNFGWRFSNPYLSALAIGLVYLFFKAFMQRRVALLAAFCLACSHYLMTFGKIGYNNLQALFALGLVLWLAARVIQNGGVAAFAFLGAGVSFCFYVYPAALYLVPLPLLLLLLYAPPRSKVLLWRWAVMAGTFLVFIFPLLLQAGFWQSKLSGTFLNQPTLAENGVNGLSHFTSNLFYAFFSFLYLPNETHFVVASYLDPISAALFVIGLAVLIWHVRSRFGGFWLVSFAYLLFVVGASHDRTYPPTTRMFLLLPWLAVGTAVGLAWLLDQWRSEGRPAGLIRVGSVVLPGLVIAANLYIAYGLAYSRTERYQVLEALSLKVAQRAAQSPEPLTMAYLCGPNWGVGGIHYLQELYGVPVSPEQIARVVVTDGTLPADAQALLESPATLVIFGHDLRDGWISTLENELLALGKTSCDIKTSNGSTRFLLWFSGNRPYLCQ